MRSRRHPWQLRGVSGFNFVELMISIVIVLLLVSVTITFYEEPRDEARQSIARIDAQRITVMIRAWQLEKRTNYLSSGLPPGYQGKAIDPWGQSYRIDPVAHAVGSAGPDGVFDSTDDISASWEIWPVLPATALPAPSVVEMTGSAVRLRWPQPPRLQSLGLRRGGPDGERFTQLSTQAAEWQDEGLDARATYTYRLEGTDTAGRPLVSSEARTFVPASSPPTLRVYASPAAGNRVRLRLEAQSHGSELVELEVGARVFPLRGTSQSIAVDVARDKSGAPIAISLTDRAGSRTTTDVK